MLKNRDMEVIKELAEISKEKCFKYTAILFLIYVAPILINDNYYYVDDIIRLVYGNHPWTRDGRPIGEWFYRMFSFAVPRQIDVYPLPLLIGLFSLLVSVVLLYRRFGQGKPLGFSLCIFPILANPFFISNLHFRYDSAFMVLSLSFGILPYAVEWKPQRLNLLLGGGLVVCAFSSYQSAVNVFIGMAAVEGYYNLLIIKNTKKAIQDMALRLLQLLVGFVVYLKIIVPLLNTKSYFNERSKIIPLDGSFLERLYHNYLSCFLGIRDVFQKGGAFIFIVLGISFFLLTIFLFRKYWMEKKPEISEALVTAFLLVLVFILSIIAVPGIVVFGEHPALLPRVYLGFGTFMAFLLLPHCWGGASERSPLQLIVPSLCAFFLFSLAYTANSVISEDYRYQNNISLSIIQNVDRLNLSNEKLLVSGAPKPPPSTEAAITAFPVIRCFMDSQSLAHVIRRNGLGGVKKLQEKDVTEMEKSVPLLSTQYYKFYSFKNAVVVRFFD